MNRFATTASESHQGIGRKELPKHQSAFNIPENETKSTNWPMMFLVGIGLAYGGYMLYNRAVVAPNPNQSVGNKEEKPPSHFLVEDKAKPKV